jgi:hypothetical protein
LRRGVPIDTIGVGVNLDSSKYYIVREEEGRKGEEGKRKGEEGRGNGREEGHTNQITNFGLEEVI